VADEDADQDARNWDAPVLCGKRAVRGDVRTSLDIYAEDSVQPQPSEPELAAALARVLGASVLYPTESIRPSSSQDWTSPTRMTRAGGGAAAPSPCPGSPHGATRYGRTWPS
jgi:hypothetical protein